MGQSRRATSSAARHSAFDVYRSNIKLPQRLAAEPGAVKLWPPQREIANSIGNADVERVTWLKAVRSGYTFLLTAAVARYLTAQARSSKKRC
jgi:phage terminase large subunit GpA-like protein